MGVSTVAEFFGASCIMLVILWKEIETLLDTRGAPGLACGDHRERLDFNACPPLPCTKNRD